MKKYHVLGSLLLAVCFVLFFSSFNVTAKTETQKRVIVVFNDGANFDLAGYGFLPGKKLNNINGQSGFIKENMLSILEKDPRVKFIANDDVVSLLAESLPWGVSRVNANDVWPSGLNGYGVKIAVVDTGIDLDHPDLAANIKGGYNAISSSRSADDDNGHGTHVAGTIAAIDNEIGVIGVAPRASLYAVKVLNSAGSGYTSDIIEGIQWAVNNGMDIISMSLGSAYYNSAFDSAVQNAYANGVIIVAATGNESTSVSYPAAYDHVIGVGATDSNNVIAYFSNYGSQVDCVAPGVSIYSTYYGGRYATMSGTSMATPHVSGVVALMIQAGTGYSYEAVMYQIQTSCIDLGAYGRDNYYGYGLVDAWGLTR